jgi:predicted LPLAT superfamily acyltransferase
MYQPVVEVVRIVADRVVWATAGAVVASTSSFVDCTMGFGPFRVSGYVCAPLFFYCAQRHTRDQPGLLNPDVYSSTMGYAPIWIVLHT